MQSKVNYGQEIGPNLIKVAKRLLNNQVLCKLLINTDLDPINPDLHPDLENPLELFGKNISVVPLVTSEEATTASKIVLAYTAGSPSANNADFESLSLMIIIYVPYKQWQITGDQLRPYAIMSEIRRSLQGKKINGLGEIYYDGFDMTSLSDETGSYTLRFTIGAFS